MPVQALLEPGAVTENADSTLAKLVAHVLPSLPDILALHDANGNYRLLSPRVQEVTGWRPSELVGGSPYHWMHPDDIPLIQRRYHNAILRGATVQGRFRFRHRQGYYVWMDFTGVPVYSNPDQPRQVSSIVTFNKEVTALVQAERAAIERSSHLSLMQDLAELAWFTFDFHSQRVTHNEAFVELTGQAASAFGGALSFRHLVVPQDRPRLRQAIRHLRRGLAGASHTLEVRLATTNHPARWVRISLAVLALQTTALNPRWQLHGAMLDIDELIRRREQTQRWVREEERTRTRERLEIAHELHDEVGQILTSLRWQIEATAPDQAPTGHPQWIASLDEANLRLRQISRRLRPPLAALGLRLAIQKLAEEHAQRWLGNTRLDLHLASVLPDTEEWRVNLLLGILRECLNNVARHAQANWVRLTVTATAKHLAIEVLDDGVGLAAERADTQHSLGLTSLQERAHLLDATLVLQSQPGQGTRVSLEVPLHNPEPP